VAQDTFWVLDDASEWCVSTISTSDFVGLVGIRICRRVCIYIGCIYERLSHLPGLVDRYPLHAIRQK
jgi:hypothetical protein